jgi:hypothetical protein
MPGPLPPTTSCPTGCPGRVVVVPLMRRQLCFCCCKQCGLLWLDGPDGRAVFSEEEYTELSRLERLYRSRRHP